MNTSNRTRNTFCRVRQNVFLVLLLVFTNYFVQCNFFISDLVTFIQLKICCCVQNIMKIRWFVAEIWRYNDCQNGGRPPSWDCFTTIREHPRSLCCWLQLPVRFHVYLIHRSENIAIWIFRIFGLKCPFRPQNRGFGGLWTPKCDYSSLRYPKGTSLHKSTSFKLSTVKIRWGVWPVGELTESVTDTHTQTHTGKFIFCPCIALDRQQRTWNDIVSVRWHFYANCTNYTTCLGMSQIYTHIYLR